ncbi:ABC transporter ATP-binding protein [Alkalibaculum bacchi]|uniref:ABC transporter ATP-binding protein n=1 Tax=Alkalibaculum bacchi TaxID=645887 RepID=UPI0026EF829C|nr:ABC transporter ATP-binding protein [Alkalibaculum bacchi]
MSITIHNLSFSYNKKNKILHSVSIKSEEGQLISLIGPNGSGKTTLIKCINRINPVQNGTVLINQVDINEIPRNDLAKQIGYVPQISREVMSGTVIETVLMGRHPHMHWKPSSEDIDIAFDVLKQLSIVELANVNFDSLSGGQKQKVLIARALAQNPQVFLFDEPISFLDIKNQIEVMEMARSMARNGKTVFVVVHDLNMALHYSDKVVLLYKGEVIANGPSQEVLNPPNIKKAYGVNVNILNESHISLWK